MLLSRGNNIQKNCIHIVFETHSVAKAAMLYRDNKIIFPYYKIKLQTLKMLTPVPLRIYEWESVDIDLFLVS